MNNGWLVELKKFKEALAKRLWALPTVTETEKEMVFKEYLSDLDGFERAMNAFTESIGSEQKASHDENDILRSLLGVPESELKIKILTLEKDRKSIEDKNASLAEEAAELRRRTYETQAENEEFRKRLRSLETESDQFRVQQLRLRENDIRFFAENHDGLKSQLKDLESRLANLRTLFTEANGKYLSEKQEEISLLQKKLLEEMEGTLRRKQELSWKEEEMFAKGVAHRVRTTLVSAQGQLMLTLERLGLLDPQTKSEAFWKARLRLLIEGASGLSENFRAIQTQLQEVTGALDDYLHLTHRKEIVSTAVSLKELVQAEMAEFYADRRPTLAIEFLSDDPLPDVPGDPALLRFAVHELLKNALEALPNEMGKIIVSLKNRSNLGVVQMMVRDSGGGVPEHLVPRLFQPFFSTKEHRQGLSLSRARRYVEFHGGTLDLMQTGPDGTMFQLELPLSVGALPRVRRALPERAA